MSLMQKFRDWRRGFTEEDVRSLQRKIAGDYGTGEITPLTLGEWRALIANQFIGIHKKQDDTKQLRAT